MKICIRGNGACPVCRKQKNCSLQERLKKAVEKVPDPDLYGMETVIYTCPAFEEEF